MNIIRKLRNIGRILFSLPSTLYFNFRYFPFKQAIHLPVVLYRPTILGNGKYILEGNAYFGKIKLGFPLVSVFKEKGVSIENNGVVIFKGSVILGGGSGVSVGKTGTLVFGDRYCNQTGGKIVCYHSIEFGDKVRVGWHTIVCDTDFHTMKSEDGLNYTKGYGPIKIGDEVWISSYCKIYKNTEIPSKCIVGASTIVSKKVDCPPCSIIHSDVSLKIRHIGYYRDIDDDKIKYI